MVKKESRKKPLDTTFIYVYRRLTKSHIRVIDTVLQCDVCRVMAGMREAMTQNGVYEWVTKQ